ncbi:NADH:ubiquinone oxidoreductase subunit 5 (subunit L)/multisubunit Na+/H+ antiporter MnhA subunit [Mycolicibacterium iranicum]|uniref:NADH:ubiquinone oxidoreductase subunit 5 (Subunit L)/multisubunit Na+/H+ antiporter MnhA subunit n=1 Tax=Mycolicibacterium iranicum TaxID=912594 RepID=A0A839Q1F7_MYCIR|nr:proton-conducting transporter membrane subunit [Mycolicibacterium iranicum]MBB2989557.1 NADH:ubiquinone oxidoreductase subunit 5 (subunit L)/multisubunit Na+/H+ antiporter MnhA subunit [Mycolicibacterium iranicum]
MLKDATLLPTVVMAPALIACTSLLARGRAVRLLATLGALTAGAGFVAAGTLITRNVVGADMAVAGDRIVGLAADNLSLVLLLLVFGVSAVVQAFAIKYLAGDPRAGRFTSAAGLLTAASAALVTADTLITLAISWTAAGAALCLLLGMYWHLPSARDGVRRTATAFVIGDAALWLAVAMVAARTGDVGIDALREIDGAYGAVVAVLVIIAALSRSAQIPFHRWLPATLSAPTPVSALLHAGVVNAGGILLIRLSALTAADAAAVLIILAGVASMVYGGLVSLVKPDVKGALAFSTMAQMGFMMFTVGMGLWAAAVIHLVAHGFYKATLFLSSGSALAHRLREAAVPTPPPPTGGRQAALLATSVALPLGALAGAVAMVPGAGDHASGLALLLFAWATGAAATRGWLRRQWSAAGIGTAAMALILAALGYLAVITGLTDFLAPALPPEELSARVVATVTLTALTMLAGFSALRWSPAQAGLYSRALAAGHLDPREKGVRP